MGAQNNGGSTRLSSETIVTSVLPGSDKGHRILEANTALAGTLGLVGNRIICETS